MKDEVKFSRALEDDEKGEGEGERDEIALEVPAALALLFPLPFEDRSGLRLLNSMMSSSSSAVLPGGV